jgi:hypothetical protein
MLRQRRGLRIVSVRMNDICRRKERARNCLKRSHFSNLFVQWGSNSLGRALYAAQAKANRTTSTTRKRSRTMTMSHESRSAEIYQFPLRGRFAAASHRDDSKSVSDLASPRVAMAAFGGNWYHEEAIQEAERARRS